MISPLIPPLALGPEEANKQLRRHWASWVTETEIMNLKLTGIDTLRIPVGDWMYAPYEPFIGCMDGALGELNRVLRLCEKHGLKAVLDIHAMKGSQVRLHTSSFPVLIITLMNRNKRIPSIDLTHPISSHSISSNLF